MSAITITAKFGSLKAQFITENTFEEFSRKIKEKFQVKDEVVLGYNKGKNDSFIKSSDDYSEFLAFLIRSNLEKVIIEVKLLTKELLEKLNETKNSVDIFLEDESSIDDEVQIKKDTRNRKFGYEYKGFYKHSYNAAERIRIFKLRRKNEDSKKCSDQLKEQKLRAKEKKKQEKKDFHDKKNKKKRLMKRDRIKLEMERLPVLLN